MLMMGLLLLSLIIYTILGVYTTMITTYQMNEMIIGTTLFVFLFGSLREYLLPDVYTTSNAIVLAIGLITWYFWTQYLTNQLNKSNGVIYT